MIDYLTVCSSDPDNDGVCSEDEVDLWDVLVYDPVSKNAVTVLTSVSPEFSPVSFTGLLRRSPARVTEAQHMDNDAFQLGDLGVTVSPDYLLDDGDRPTDPIALLIPSIVAILVAAVIVIGSVSGPRFRPGGGWPSRVSTFAPGRADARPCHRRPAHTCRPATQVREVDADLRPVPLVAADAATRGSHDRTDRSDGRCRGPAARRPGGSRRGALPTPIVEPAPSPADPPIAPPPDPTNAPPTTLILERRGRPHGVAVGRGEPTAIAPGTVSRLRGTRPALRLSAGTGTLLVSFDTTANRDRAASELAAEAEI